MKVFSSKAGLKAGDIFLELDGKSVSKYSVEDVCRVERDPLKRH